ncbi:MAG: hypothetical protein E7412_07245 [Ruminococcaceae bacterium]|nr:hypothetical protein [Oscillospiraceae bacterium]
MTDIFFYDFDFRLVEQFEKFTSLNISKKYCGYGTVEMHFPVTEARVIELLENNSFLLGVAKDVHFVVTGWQFGEDLAVFGKTLEWLLGKRCVAPFSLSGKTGEQAAVYAIETAMSDFVSVGELSGIGEKKDFSFDKAKTVLDIVCEALGPEKLGFSLKVDKGAARLVFSVFEGKELPLVLSRSYRNACGIKYSVNLQKKVDNCGWYERKIELLGEWKASSNQPELYTGSTQNKFTAYLITEGGDRFGLQCYAGQYLYCDTIDGRWKVAEKLPDTGWDFFDGSTMTDGRRWECIIEGVKTPEEAEQEIIALGTEEELETDLRHIEYGRDYELGDTIRVCAEFGSALHIKKRRVVGVDIYYDEDICGSTPLFQE